LRWSTIAAESGQTRNVVGEIDFQIGLEITPLVIVHGRIDQIRHLLGLDRWNIDSVNVAVDPDHGRKSRREMQVGCVVLDRERQ